MASFNFSERPVTAERFSDLPGFNQWTNLLQEPTLGNLISLRSAGVEIQKTHKSSCPRVFVSHRQADAQLALRAAKLVCDNSMEYWLDIHDPSLTKLNLVPGTPKGNIVIAGIIEMALINCTHVLAIMTPQVRGSLWVPYEYGRITDVPTHLGRAASWLHPGFVDPPEYLSFGIMAKREIDITSWLILERVAWAGGSCNCTWTGGPTDPLPRS